MHRMGLLSSTKLGDSGVDSRGKKSTGRKRDCKKPGVKSHLCQDIVDLSFHAIRGVVGAQLDLRWRWTWRHRSVQLHPGPLEAQSRDRSNKTLWQPRCRLSHADYRSHSIPAGRGQSYRDVYRGGWSLWPRASSIQPPSVAVLTQLYNVPYLHVRISAASAG